MKFVAEWWRRADATEGHVNMAELCRDFGVSRKTGYKWLARFEHDNPASLEDRSRRPLSHPNKTPDWLEDGIVAAPKQFPTWGPKKLRPWLMRCNPGVELPSTATIGRILDRRGLTRPRKKRRRKQAVFSAPFLGCDAPIDVWCADFKGWFRTGRRKCHPLTLTDGYSRMFLRCEGLSRPRHEHVARVFESAFCEYGLPNAIRTDNRPPFSSPAVGGLSRLSVRWMRLGIRHKRIEPGHPEQNGRHERMHRTLKAKTASPPASSLAAQQRRMDAFRRTFNEDRPHEALAMQTPASIYESSARPLPKHLPAYRYPRELFT